MVTKETVERLTEEEERMLDRKNMGEESKDFYIRIASNGDKSYVSLHGTMEDMLVGLATIINTIEEECGMSWAETLESLILMASADKDEQELKS